MVVVAPRRGGVLVVGRVVAVSMSYRRRVLMWLWCRRGIVVVWASLCWVGHVVFGPCRLGLSFCRYVVLGHRSSLGSCRAGSLLCRLCRRHAVVLGCRSSLSPWVGVQTVCGRVIREGGFTWFERGGCQ